ncbi:hypothetical protein [Stenotrophomonas sp. PS02301]|uniref:hypothetical protein n=1 Tax=Stenotrophomonas sp. PS02301 TaxID=2991427 RepID=UPI00249A6D1D|nr:hypothetical protein [Stenotrophomonas sp. PS02301]
MSQAEWKKIDEACRAAFTDEQVQQKIAYASQLLGSGGMSREDVLNQGDLVTRHLWMVYEAQDLLHTWNASADIQAVKDEDSLLGMVDAETGNIVAFTADFSDIAEIEVELPKGKYAVASYSDLLIGVFDSFNEYRAKWVDAFGDNSQQKAQGDVDGMESMVNSLDAMLDAGGAKGLMQQLATERLIDADEDASQGHDVLRSNLDQMSKIANAYKPPSTIYEARQQAASVFREPSDIFLEGVIKGLYQRKLDDMDEGDLRHSAIAAIRIASRHLHEIANVDFDEKTQFSRIRSVVDDDGAIQSYQLNGHHVIFGDEPLVEGDEFVVDGGFVYDSVFYVDAETRTLVDIANRISKKSGEREGEVMKFPSLIDLIEGRGHDHLKIVANNLKVIDGVALDQVNQSLVLALQVAKMQFRDAELETVDAYIRVRYAMRDSGDAGWVVAQSGRAVIGKHTAIMLNHTGGTPDQFTDTQIALFGCNALYFVNSDGVSRFDRSGS